jgi:hypothetical protein
MSIHEYRLNMRTVNERAHAATFSCRRVIQPVFRGRSRLIVLSHAVATLDGEEVASGFCGIEGANIELVGESL